MIQTLNLNVIRNTIMLLAILLLFSLLSTSIDYTPTDNTSTEILVDPNWPYDTPYISNPIKPE